MAALDEGSLQIQYGNIFIGTNAGDAVNVGALRNVVFTAVQNHVRVESDNRGTIIDKARLNGKVDAELLEVSNMTVLENAFKGLVTKTTVAGTIVNNYPQVVASGGWLFDKFIPFDNQDADGTYPNVDSVTLGTDGAIVLNTDYHKVQDPATLKWGIIIRDTTTVTTEAQSVTIQYDYTPASSLVLTGGTSQTATVRYIKIEGPSEDDASIKRTIVLESAVITSDLVMKFLDVEQTGDVGTMPITFESRKGTSWTITDAINPT